jgi:hypothetical protein
VLYFILHIYCLFVYIVDNLTEEKQICMKYKFVKGLLTTDSLRGSSRSVAAVDLMRVVDLCVTCAARGKRCNTADDLNFLALI